MAYSAILVYGAGPVIQKPFQTKTDTSIVVVLVVVVHGLV